MVTLEKPNGLGLMRVLRAAACSMAGLRSAWKNEAAFRQELTLCCVMAPIAIFLGDTGIERALMLGSLVMVLIVELLNSAVEAVVDRVSTQHHELSGRAKDIASAAVFLSLLNVVIIWVLLLF